VTRTLNEPLALSTQCSIGSRTASGSPYRPLAPEQIFATKRPVRQSALSEEDYLPMLALMALFGQLAYE